MISEDRVDRIYLPCEGTAVMVDGDHGYTCERCMCVIGSIGEPRDCSDLREKYAMFESLGGFGWDYKTGKVATK